MILSSQADVPLIPLDAVTMEADVEVMPQMGRVPNIDSPIDIAVWQLPGKGHVHRVKHFSTILETIS